MYYYITPYVPCLCIIFQENIVHMSVGTCHTNMLCCVYYMLCILILFFYIVHASIGFGFEGKFMETKFLGFEFCISRWSKYILPWDVIFKLWDICVRKEMVMRLLKYYTPSLLIRFILIINGDISLLNKLIACMSNSCWWIWF